MTSEVAPKENGLGYPVLGGLVLGVLLIGFYAHTYGFALDLSVALKGFSILEALEARHNPSGFARDFPGGAALASLSTATTYLYFALEDLFGFSGLSMLYGMIFLEMAALLAGARVFWLAITEQFSGTDAPNRLQADIVFVWLALILIVSAAQRANIVNFGFPFFHGQFYGFADGLRLAAIGLALRQRWALCALLLAIGFTIHPIKSVIGGFFVFSIACFTWRGLFGLKSIAAALAAGCLCLVWYDQMLTSDFEDVALDDFVDYTTILQSHWYPVAFGLFGERHLRGLSPFAAILLTLAVSLTQPGWPPLLRKQLLAGYALLLAVTVAGIYISVDASSISLIRLCLARASNLISLTAPFLIFAAALLAWRRRRWMVAAGLIAVLAAGFHPSEGIHHISLVFALSLTVFVCIRYDRQNLLLILAALSGLAVLLWVMTTTSGPYQSFQTALIAFAAASALGFLFAATSATQRPVALAAITLFMFAGGAFYAWEKVAKTIPKRDIQASFLQAQLWAKDKTPQTALFAVDPCLFYGWRDFSGRPSIGTVREWYMTAWIYIGGKHRLEQGKAYAASLGFDMEPFRHNPKSRRAICDAAREAYYQPRLQAQHRLSSAHGVDYFVFNKEYAAGWLGNIKDRLSFENEHFAILAAADIPE